MVLSELKNIINADEKFTFLVGAGVSMESPSNLKSAVQIVKILIKLCAPEKEVSKILSLEGLRYETVVEFIQKYFDKELKIIDFFENFTQPNIHHYFLAQCIKKGQQVITTNFDYLIEFALLRIFEDKSKILPVISRRDFMNYADPNNLIEKGKFPIYKIHGSKKNIITNEDTHDSLVTTISALGRDRDEKTFAIEGYKKPAMYNLIEGRTLIVMGYSGGDDFDITPTLKEIKNFEKLIWINHTNNDIPQIIKIDANSKTKEENIDANTSLLIELVENSTNSKHPITIFKINVNTAIFVKNYLWELLLNDIEKPQVSDRLSVDFDYENWFFETLKPIDDLSKFLFNWELYYRLAQPDEALRIGEIGISYAEERGDDNLKASFLNNNGLIYLDKGNPQAAIENYEKALELGTIEGSSMTLNNLAMVYKSQRDYEKALEWLKKALNAAENSDNIIEIITILNNLGLTNYSEGRYQEALEYYEEALERNKVKGDLGIKSRLISNIASVFFSKNEYKNALDKFQEALQISEELGDLNGVTVRLNNIASVYSQQGKKELAIKYYQKALEKVELLGDLAKKAIYLTNMALLYSELDSKEKAVHLFEEALPIDKLLNDMERILFDLKKAGIIYEDIGEYNNALSKYEESLDYYENVNDLGGVSGTLNDIAMVYYNQGRLTRAIETLEKAIDIAIKGGFGSTPEVQDFRYGLDQLNQKLQDVADLEAIVKNNEINNQAQIEQLKDGKIIKAIIEDVNKNPYILEGYLWEKGKGKSFLENVLEIVQKKPDEEEVLITSGYLLLFLKKNDEALLRFESVLAINPNSLNANLGIILYNLNNKELDKALNLLNELELTTNYLVPFLFASTYLKMKEFQKSENYAKKVIDMNPDFLPVLINLGTIYFFRNDLEKALSFYQNAVDINPDYFKSYSNLGFIYFKQNQLDKAEEIFKKVLELDVDDNYTLSMLARIYFNTKQTSKGEWVLKRMILLNPKNKDALQNLAGLYYNAGNYKKAEIYYKKALQLNPDDLTNLKFLMNTYRGMGNYQHADELKKKIADLSN